MTDVGDKSRVGVHLGCTFGESAITMRVNFGQVYVEIGCSVVTNFAGMTIIELLLF